MNGLLVKSDEALLGWQSPSDQQLSVLLMDAIAFTIRQN